MSHRPPHLPQQVVHRLQAKLFSVKLPTSPTTEMLKFFMSRLEDGLQELLIAERSPTSSGGHRRSPARQIGFVAPSDGTIFSNRISCRQSSPKSYTYTIESASASSTLPTGTRLSSMMAISSSNSLFCGSPQYSPSFSNWCRWLSVQPMTAWMASWGQHSGIVLGTSV